MSLHAKVQPEIDALEARRRLQGSTILVLGADAHSSGTAFITLDHIGCRVRLARRAVQASHVLRDVHADIVIVDADNLKEEPASLVATMRAAQELAGARLIALTAKDRRRHKSLAAAGFEAVLPKPLDPRSFPCELAAAMPSPQVSPQAGPPGLSRVLG